LGPLVGAVGPGSGGEILQPVMAPSARGAACRMSRRWPLPPLAIERPRPYLGSSLVLLHSSSLLACCRPSSTAGDLGRPALAQRALTRIWRLPWTTCAAVEPNLGRVGCQGLRGASERSGCRCSNFLLPPLSAGQRRPSSTATIHRGAVA
jgi:hypothetical protein